MPAGQYEIDTHIRNADSRSRYKNLSGGWASFAPVSAPRSRCGSAASSLATPGPRLLAHRNDAAFDNETATTNESGATARGEGGEEHEDDADGHPAV